MKKFLIFLLIISIAVAGFFCFTNLKFTNNPSTDVSSNSNTDVHKTDTTFTLTAIGDVMCHNTQYWDAYNKDTDTYDFSYVFEDISHYIANADISVGSLETSFAGKERGYSNYTYGTNGIPVPSNKDFCVNLIDKDLIKKHITSAKEQNVDMIVACMHWGTEYRTTANSEQEELAGFLFQNGVDVILGNHPHVLEQMEKRTITLEDGTTKDGFVIYACGNFICDQNAENTRNSIILNLTITKHTDGKITIDKADYVPIYMYKGVSSKLKRMKLLDIEKTISDYETGANTSISQTTYNDLKNQLEKIKSIVGDEIN